MNTQPVKVVLDPPLIFMVPLVAGIALRFLWVPLALFPYGWIGHAAGWPLAAAAALIFGWSLATMFRQGEHPRHDRPTQGVVSSGPFAYSRNPIYLSMVLLYVGISLVLNTGWPLIFLPAALVVLHFGVILREEEYLERLFGQEYRDYRTRVRRWV